ncbi:MAG TPA: VWA domain-containing protein, partial [Thermoanaerobaculia bacterium]
MRARAFCIVSLLLPLLASAQQKPPVPSIGETIEVSLVNLDVFVTDKTGQRVRGLKKDDFEILENGSKQPITNFTEYAGEVTAAQQTPETPAPSVPAPAPRQKRTLVVFVERFSLPSFRTDPFFASIKRLLHDAIRPGDRATIVTWNRGVLLTQQEFTDALPALDHALDAVAKLSSRPMTDLRSDMRWMIDFARSFDDQAAGAGTWTNGNGIADMEMDAYAQLEKFSQMQMVRTLNAVIRTIAADEGKKVMLLVTHRLSREAGAETYWGNMRDQGPIPLEKRAAMDMSAALKSIDDTANANGVTMHPMFPEGLEATVTDSSEATALRSVDYQRLNNEMHALREIAEETGGLTAAGTDANRLLPRIGEDLDSYYSLAYRVRNTG